MIDRYGEEIDTEEERKERLRQHPLYPKARGFAEFILKKKKGVDTSEFNRQNAKEEAFDTFIKGEEAPAGEPTPSPL